MHAKSTVGCRVDPLLYSMDSDDDDKHAPTRTYQSRKAGVAVGAREGWRGKRPR